MASGNMNIKDHGFKKQEDCTPEEWERHELYRSRQKGVPKTYVWTKDRIREQLDLCMTSLKHLLVDAEKVDNKTPLKARREMVRDLITLINKLSDMMKLLYPEIQKSENLNYNMTICDTMIERLMEFKRKDKEEPIIEIVPQGRFDALKEVNL